MSYSLTIDSNTPILELSLQMSVRLMLVTGGDPKVTREGLQLETGTAVSKHCDWTCSGGVTCSMDRGFAGIESGETQEMLLHLQQSGQ